MYLNLEKKFTLAHEPNFHDFSFVAVRCTTTTIQIKFEKEERKTTIKMQTCNLAI